MARWTAAALAALIVIASIGPLVAQPIVELRYLCYSDADECEVARELLDRFERDNADIRVVVDKVSYIVVREQLETRLNAGQGPDMARVTNLGGLNRFYLDLTPHIDRPAWEAAFGPTLDWMRSGSRDRGVYGFLTQLTVSGPFVNRTLFERAGVALPGPQADWDEWAEAVREVKRRTGAYAGIAFDRSGHRFAGPAISLGEVFLGEEGRLLPLGAGFRAFADRLVRWHREELMPRDLWPSATGARHRSGAEMFSNGDAVMHFAGSWLIQRYAEAIGDRFDWISVPNPCGPAGCSGMPGGAAMVAFKHTRHPSAVGRVMSYLASEPALREFYARTLQIPAHLGLAERGVDYPADTPAAARAALRVFTEGFRQVRPEAHRLQAYPGNQILFNAIAEHVTNVIVGNVTLDDAARRIEAEARRAR